MLEGQIFKNKISHFKLLDIEAKELLDIEAKETPNEICAGFPVLRSLSLEVQIVCHGLDIRHSTDVHC